MMGVDMLSSLSIELECGSLESLGTHLDCDFSFLSIVLNADDELSVEHSHVWLGENFKTCGVAIAYSLEACCS